MHFQKMLLLNYVFKTPFLSFKRRHQKKYHFSVDILWKNIGTWFCKLKGKDILKVFALFFFFNILNYCMAETVTYSKSGWILCKWY